MIRLQLVLIWLLSFPGFIICQSTNKNHIISWTYPNGKTPVPINGLTDLEQPNSSAQKSLGYFNGWAESIQSLSISDLSGYVIVANMYYDSRGRLTVSTKPLQITSNDSLNYKNFTGWMTDSSFTRTVYYNKVSSRAQYQMPFGDPYHKNGHYLKFNFYLDTAVKAYINESIDEDGNTSQIFTDGFGSKIRQVTKMDSGNELRTGFEYDLIGNLKKTIAPLGYVKVDTLRSEQKMGLSASTTVETLRFSKPEGALSSTVNAFVSDTFFYDGPDPNPKQCSYSLTMEYRTLKSNGVYDLWKTISNNYLTLNLAPEDTAFEVRKTLLQNGGPPGCWPQEVYMHLNTVTAAMNEAKYVTSYKYDKRGLLIEKNSPDEGKTLYVYDTMGRLRFTQDENHRTNLIFNGRRSYWTYYKYDALGRMFEQGELTQNYVKDSLQVKATRLRYRTDYTVSPAICDTVVRDSIMCFESRARRSIDAQLPPGEGEPVCDTVPFTFIYCHTDTTYTTTAIDTLYGPRSFPTSTDSALQTVINQYDLYGNAGWNINPGTDSVNTGANPVNFPKTRLTRTKILDANTNTWSEECYTYDKYGRVTTRRVHIPELAQSKKFQYYYDASGRVLKTMYQDGVAAESFYQWFKYDNLSRLDSVFSSRTNNRATAVREAAYDYDNNHGGKILTAKLGNNIQQVDYTYNSRDWLKYINDVNNIGTDQFALSLGYDTVATNPRFNGNIAASASLVSGQSQYAYNYVYDKANRLTDANYSGNLFSEKTIGYDANGNITALTRHLNSASATPITYAYDAAKPNQLKYVTGALADSFYYDANGNMTRDKLKGNFDYDYRNMPIKMYLNSGKVIHIAYDAGGQRTKFLRKSGSTTQDSSKIFMLGANGKVIAEYIYLGSVWQVDHYNIYGNELIGKVALIPATSGTVIKTGQINTSQTADSLNLQNSQIQSGGSVTLLAKNGIRVQSTFNSNGATVSLRPGVAAAGSGATGGFTDVRYYYLTDHLGSVRVTLTETGVVDSWSDYYPFGKEARGSNTVNEPKEQFTGKEYDAESDLSYFGARYYNANIARWTSVDPLHQYESGYVYVGNNPMVLIDPTGLESAPAGCTAINQFNNRVAFWEGGSTGISSGNGDGEKDGAERKKIGWAVIKSTDSETLGKVRVKASSKLIKSRGKDNQLMTDGFVNLDALKSTLETMEKPSVEDPRYVQYEIAKEIEADLGFESGNGKTTFDIYDDSRILSTGSTVNIVITPPTDVTKLSNGVVHFNRRQEITNWDRFIEDAGELFRKANGARNK